MTDDRNLVRASPPQRKLVGAQATDGPLVGSQSTEAPLAAAAPLGAPATVTTLLSTGLVLSSSRRRHLLDLARPITGQRVMCSIDFYDARTKVAVTPSNVRIQLEAPDATETEVTIAEDPARMGHFIGSFVP